MWGILESPEFVTTCTHNVVEDSRYQCPRRCLGLEGVSGCAGKLLRIAPAAHCASRLPVSRRSERLRETPVPFLNACYF